MSGRERGVVVAHDGTASAGLEFWGESLDLHSLLRGGGLDDGGDLLRSSSKFGDMSPRPFEALMLFSFEYCKFNLQLKSWNTLLSIKIIFVFCNFSLVSLIWIRRDGCHLFDYLFVVVLIALGVGEATNLKRLCSSQKCWQLSLRYINFSSIHKLQKGLKMFKLHISHEYYWMLARICLKFQSEENKLTDKAKCV